MMSDYFIFFSKKFKWHADKYANMYIFEMFKGLFAVRMDINLLSMIL